MSAIARWVALSHCGTSIGLDIQKRRAIKCYPRDPLGLVNVLPLATAAVAAARVIGSRPRKNRKDAEKRESSPAEWRAAAIGRTAP